MNSDYTNFRIFKGREELIHTNEPYPFKKEDSLTIIPKFTFKPDDLGLAVLKDILPRLSDYRIIIAAAAITDDIDKNISQQFQFNNYPIHRTLIIDKGFFSQYTYDFYKYIYFENIPTKYPEVNQILKKPAETPIEIDMTYNDIPRHEKELYYQKLMDYSLSHNVNLYEKELFFYLVKYDYQTMSVIDILKKLDLQIPPIYSWTGKSI